MKYKRRMVFEFMFEKRQRRRATLTLETGATRHSHSPLADERVPLARATPFARSRSSPPPTTTVILHHCRGPEVKLNGPSHFHQNEVPPATIHSLVPDGTLPQSFHLKIDPTHFLSFGLALRSSIEAFRIAIPFTQHLGHESSSGEPERKLPNYNFYDF